MQDEEDEEEEEEEEEEQGESLITSQAARNHVFPILVNELVKESILTSKQVRFFSFSLFGWLFLDSQYFVLFNHTHVFLLCGSF